MDIVSAFFRMKLLNAVFLCVCLTACEQDKSTDFVTMNASPVADAGPDQTVNEQVLVTLDGSASSDSDGSIIDYSWLQIAGVPVSLDHQSTVSPVFTRPDTSVIETLRFELTVTDDDGDFAVDTVDIILAVNASPVVNAAPVANAGVDQTIDEQVLVTLNGSASNDSDGSIVSYSWSQIAGTQVALSDDSVVNPTFSGPNIAITETLSFKLTVTDNHAETASSSVNITLTANAAPTANAGINQVVDEQLLVTLDGSASNDSDGSISTYSWSQTAGVAVTLSGDSTVSPTFTGPNINTTGTLSFELTVTDNDGDTASATVDIILQANTAPTANAGIDQTVKKQLQVTLNGSASSDSDGLIASYSWSQLAGTSVTLSDASSASPTFAGPDISVTETLSFELTVIDNDGDASMDTVAIVISAETCARGITCAYIIGGGDTVSVYDVADKSLQATVLVGDDPRAIAITPDRSLALVANSGSDDVSIINVETNTTVATSVAVGDYPWALAIGPYNQRAYVVNAHSNNVSVIDLVSRMVVATVAVGQLPSGVVVSPSGKEIYVTNYFDGTVSVINAADHSVSNITVGSNPVGIAATTTLLGGASIYVANKGSNNVSVIEVEGKSVSNIALGVFDPFELSITPDGARVYVHDNNSRFSVIDVATQTVMGAPVTLANGLNSILALPDAAHIYLSNRDNNLIHVVEVATNTVVDTISTTYPLGMAVTPAPELKIMPPTCINPQVDCLYLVDESTGLSVFNLADQSLVKTLGFGEIVRWPAHVDLSPDGQFSYQGGDSDFEISVVHVATNAVVATVPIAGYGIEMAATPDNRQIYVAHIGGVTVVNHLDYTTSSLNLGGGVDAVKVNPNGKQVFALRSSGTVSIIDTASNTVSQTVTVGNNIYDLDITPDGSRVYVSTAAGTVIIIDAKTGVIIGNAISVGSEPKRVKVSPDGAYVLVANVGSKNVSVINTASNTVESLIILPDIFGYAAQIAFSSDASKAYVTTSFEENYISIIDMASKSIVDTFNLPVSSVHDFSVTP